jgi:tryptophan-rich sensory protein
MLTVAPPHWSDEEQALMAVAHWWDLFALTKSRALVFVVTALHLIAAVTLVAAPHVQLFTQGTRPVFSLFPPPVWAAAFLLGGLASGSLLFRLSGRRLAVALFTVYPTQTMWIGASVIAVWQGRGSSMGVVFLTAVFAFTVITGAVAAADFASGKR